MRMPGNGSFHLRDAQGWLISASPRLQDSEQAVEWAAVNLYKPGTHKPGCCHAIYSVIIITRSCSPAGTHRGVSCFSAGDEFHLVHIVKDETEKLREYYQEKSLGMPPQTCASPSHHLWGLCLPVVGIQHGSPFQPTTFRPHSHPTAVEHVLHLDRLYKLSAPVLRLAYADHLLPYTATACSRSHLLVLGRFAPCHCASVQKSHLHRPLLLSLLPTGC